MTKTKMMITLLIIIALLPVSVILITFCPLKSAINISQIDNSKNYIFAEITDSTGFEFVMTGDKQRKDGLMEYVHVIGNYPDTNKLDDSLIRALETKNLFVLYGEFSESPYETFDLPPNVPAKVFVVQSWDILYPIQRNDWSSAYRKRFLAFFDY